MSSRENISAGAAVVAVIAACVSAWYAGAALRVSKRQLLVQEQSTKIESRLERERMRENQQAVLKATLYRARGNADLVVTNEGRASARAISLVIDSTPIIEHKLFIEPRVLPSQLGAGESVRFVLFTHNGSAENYAVVLDWEDDTGEPQHWERTLTLD